MTPAQYDDIRKKLRGVEFRYGINAAQLDPQIRNRAGYRLTLPQRFEKNSRHDAGSFVFAGFLWEWHFENCLGFLSLHLDITDDMFAGHT